jgi:mono/diheme cytochrome c family protein
VNKGRIDLTKLKTRGVMKTIITIIILIIIAFIVFLIYINSGLYNIAATHEHNPITLTIINTITNASEERHSKGIEVPDLSNSDMIRTGFEIYNSTCRVCHGAIGISGDEFAKAMYPEPPNLQESAKELPANQVFWITRSGIKFTGMPAISEIEADSTIWAITAFVMQLPNMTYQDYVNMGSADTASAADTTAATDTTGTGE